LEPIIYNDLLRYSKNEQGNNLKLTNIFRGKLNDKANELYMAGKKHESGLVKELKDALDLDINHAFENSGNPEIKELYNKTQREYKENYAPFEDKDIVKFTRQGGDPDLIMSHFIRSGKNDRAVLLHKLNSSLQRKHKLDQSKNTPNLNMTSAAYFSKALDDAGSIDPVKFSALYNKLGKNQQKALFGDKKLHEEAKQFASLVAKNKEAFNLMFNPKTGARNAELISKLGQIATGTTLGLPGIAGLAVGGIAGNIANKALTSETLRNRLIKAMIQNKEINPSGFAKAGSISAGMGYGNHPLELELVGGRRE